MELTLLLLLVLNGEDQVAWGVAGNGDEPFPDLRPVKVDGNDIGAQIHQGDIGTHGRPSTQQDEILQKIQTKPWSGAHPILIASFLSAVCYMGTHLVGEVKPLGVLYHLLDGIPAGGLNGAKIRPLVQLLQELLSLEDTPLVRHFQFIPMGGLGLVAFDASWTGSGVGGGNGNHHQISQLSLMLSPNWIGHIPVV